MMPLGDVPAVTGEWECTECGYVEEGVSARRPRECPDCGAPAQAFEFFACEDEDDSWEEAAGEDPAGSSRMRTYLGPVCNYTARPDVLD